MIQPTPNGVLGQHADLADVRTIGIPRALLYYRYGALWTTFFESLGRTVVLSEPSDRGMFETGDAASVDECCLASKIYLGHVESLLGKADALFVPSIVNMGHRKGFCTKFQSLPDLVANSFPDCGMRIVSCLVEEKGTRAMARDSLLGLAKRFGAGPREAKRALKSAVAAQNASAKSVYLAQERVLAEIESRPADSRPLRILVMAHPYVAHDPYIGQPVVDMLKEMGACVLLADCVDGERAFKKSLEFSAPSPGSSTASS